jgi:hypothetical protein
MQLRRRLLLFAVVAMLGVCPMLAANIVYTVTGTLGPVLSGSDPLGANGQSGTLTAAIGQGAVPKSTTSTSATYQVPQGAVQVIIGGTTYTTSGAATLVYKFPSTGPSALVVSAKVKVLGITGTVVGTATLAKGSFTTAVKTHPTKFKPSPQTLKAATKAGGLGSQVKYSALGSTTVLGLNGSASN